MGRSRGRPQSPKLMPMLLASLMMELSGLTVFSLPATSWRGTGTISPLTSPTMLPLTPTSIRWWSPNSVLLVKL